MRKWIDLFEDKNASFSIPSEIASEIRSRFRLVNAASALSVVHNYNNRITYNNCEDFRRIIDDRDIAFEIGQDIERLIGHKWDSDFSLLTSLARRLELPVYDPTFNAACFPPELINRLNHSLPNLCIYSLVTDTGHKMEQIVRLLGFWLPKFAGVENLKDYFEIDKHAIIKMLLTLIKHNSESIGYVSWFELFDMLIYKINLDWPELKMMLRSAAASYKKEK